jgi:hypothetical protein
MNLMQRSAYGGCIFLRCAVDGDPWATRCRTRSLSSGVNVFRKTVITKVQRGSRLDIDAGREDRRARNRFRRRAYADGCGQCAQETRVDRMPDECVWTALDDVMICFARDRG